MTISRREFTMFGALGTVSLAGGLLPTIPLGAKPAIRGRPWYTQIKRIGQTNFNERDAASGNVDEWADYWASAKVQALALSVSGPVAFYPTKVPYFHISDYLNGRDLFGECVAAAKKRGIRVFGRMSPDIQYTDPALLAAHPEWFRRDKAGKLQSTAPDIASTCQFTGQFTEQQPAILRELLSRYEIDGVYMNGWPTMQECYCQACRNIGDPRSDKYKAILMEDAIRLTELYRSIVTAKHPHNFYSCNVAGSMDDSGLDQWRLTRRANWYTADNQARSGVADPVWQGAQQVRYAHAMMGDRPVAAITGAYTRSGPTWWRQVSNSTVEPMIRMAQTAAAGGIIWYHQLGFEQGFNVDRRWQEPGREFLSWHAANEAHFHNVASLANVAIVLPTNTMGKRIGVNGKASDYMQGFYAALVDARIAFDFIHENDLSAEKLAPYDLLILPNFALMSDHQAATLRAFARGGGSLLGTYQTGLYDAVGQKRPDFALGDLFGISKAGDAVAVKGSPPFVPIQLQSIRTRGPILEGFSETEWIAGPTWTQPIKPVADAPLTYVEAYPVYPPESVYPRSKPGNQPSMVTRQLGGGRMVYFAGDMDATYWRLDNPDLGQQLVNAVRWALNGKAPVTVTGDGLMEVIAWKTQPGYAVHFLNYNGPNAFRGHMRKPVPLGPQLVRLTLPNAIQVRSAGLLQAGQMIAFDQIGQTVHVTVPAIGLYEVLAIETE